MAIRVMDMFCGISAFRSAAEKIGGFEFVGYCECDPTAIAAYRTLYDTRGEYFCNDARAINTDELPDFDLLVGGFPCQDFSQSGRRLGFNSSRGTLFFELARLLEAKKPAYFLFENVSAILSFDHYKVFETILNEISKLGYCCEWQCIDGRNYLPQSRKRVFIAVISRETLKKSIQPTLGLFFSRGRIDGKPFFSVSLDSRCAGQILPLRGKIAAAVAELTSHRTQGERVYDSDGSAVTQTATGGGFGGKTGMYFIDMNDNAKMTEVARCITTRQDSGIGKHKGEKSGVFVEYDGVYPVINPDRETVRQNGPRIRPNGAPAFCLTVVDRHGVIHHGRVRRLVPQECFRLMGFEDSQFFRLQNELHLSDAKLYKLAGNSIIVPILADIMTNIKQVNAKYGIVKER